MKLELGSGRHPTPGFVHVDLNPGVDPDVRCDVRDLAPFDDASVDEIRAVDILEHVSYRDTEATLAEWARVLKRGGRLYVQVPDAGRVLSWLAREEPGESLLLKRGQELYDQGVSPGLGEMDALNVILLGGHRDGDHVREGDDFRLNAHFALFSQASLELKLSLAGFDVESCVTNQHPNLCCWAVKE